MKEKKNKKLEEFAKKVENLKLKKEQPSVELISDKFSKDIKTRKVEGINDFSKIYGEEKYKKIMEKFKNIKK
jgi:hypothetical protein